MKHVCLSAFMIGHIDPMAFFLHDLETLHFPNELVKTAMTPLRVTAVVQISEVR